MPTARILPIPPQTKSAPIMGRHDILLFQPKHWRRSSNQRRVHATSSSFEQVSDYPMKVSPDVSLGDPSRGSSRCAPRLQMTSQSQRDGSSWYTDDLYVEKWERDCKGNDVDWFVTRRSSVGKTSSASSPRNSALSLSSRCESVSSMSDGSVSLSLGPSLMMRSKDSMEFRHFEKKKRDNARRRSRQVGSDTQSFNERENAYAKFDRLEYDQRLYIRDMDRRSLEEMNARGKAEINRESCYERKSRSVPSVERRVIFGQYWMARHDDIEKAGLFELNKSAVEIPCTRSIDSNVSTTQQTGSVELQGKVETNQRVRQKGKESTKKGDSSKRRRNKKKKLVGILRKNPSSMDSLPYECDNIKSPDGVQSYFARAGSYLSCVDTKSASVSFSPKVNVLEFRRSRVEYPIASRWFSPDEIAQFKREALQEAYPNASRQCTSLSSFPHDKYNDGNVMKSMNETKDEKQSTIWQEIHNILIVDTHKSIHVLLARNINRIFPHIVIRTASSTEEAIEKIEIAKQNESNCALHGFDIIIIEERVNENIQTRYNEDIDREATPAHFPSDSTIQLDEAVGKTSLLRTISDKQISRNKDKHSLLISLSPVSTANTVSKLQQNGADLVWGIPPPRMTVEIRDYLLNAVLKKRGKKLLQY